MTPLTAASCEIMIEANLLSEHRRMDNSERLRRAPITDTPSEATRSRMQQNPEEIS